LQARLNDMPGKKMNVLAEGKSLSIPSIDLSLSDTLTSLLTQPGKVSIYRSNEPTASPDNTQPVLTGEDFVSAALKREDEPDQQLIQLILTEECAGRLTAQLKLDPAARFYLYVDGEPIHNTPIEIANEGILKIRHLDAEDACYYRAILNNDALPFEVSLDKKDQISG
jgi:preprotein translocase subunit SecD